MIKRCAVILIALLGGCAAGPGIAIYNSSGQPPQIKVSGLNQRDLAQFESLPRERREQALRVWVAGAAADSPPVLGDVRQRDGELIFRPRYPFQAGLTYRARFDPGVLGMKGSAIEGQYTIPAPSSEPVTRVSAIYPSSDVLPENLLKFYIHFSGPMSRGEAYRRVQLIDEAGRPVEYPFLELSEELWNPEMTRFTLFFEPGRVKEGLVPRQELGPALIRGHSYTLVVDGGWRDGENRPLVEAAKKTFRVGPADHAQPDPSRWQINSPRAGSNDALSIEFDKALDHAMLGHVLSVRDAAGRELGGTVSIDEQEQRWSFAPRLPWQRGRYVVVVETTLEDLAGNSIGRPFEVDLNKASPPGAPETVEIRFDVSYWNLNKG